MSFFGNLKKSLGLSSSSRSGNKTNCSPHQVYELTFVQQKLGMGLNLFTGHVLPTNVDGAIIKGGNDPNRSWAIITSVSKTSEAYEYGVRKGDIIIALERTEITSFEDFSSFIVAMGRPVTLRFLRLSPDYLENANNTSSSSSESNPTNDSNTSSGITNSLQSMNSSFVDMIRSVGSNNSTTTSTAAPTLTEEEKEKRRQQNASAALARSNQWDKSLSEKRVQREQKAKQQNSNQTAHAAPVTVLDPSSGRLVEVGSDTAKTSSNPTTQRSIQQTKAMEARVEKDMGYNPFRPHMSAAGNTPAGPVAEAAAVASGQSVLQETSVVPPVPPTANEETSTTPAVVEDDIDEWVADVDDAFAMLLSLGESEQEKAKVAVQTVHKMLLNLQKHKNEVKFRSIRVANNAFQAKVNCVPGGPELLLAAGYYYQESSPSSATTTTATAATQEVKSEMYLLHKMDVKSQRRLQYTIMRLEELLESNESPS